MAVLHALKAEAQSKFKPPQLIKYTDTMLSKLHYPKMLKQNANTFNTCLALYII